MMEFLKKEWLKIGIFFFGVALVLSFFGLNSHNEVPPTSSLSTSDAVKKIYQKYGYGPGPKFLFSDDRRVWFSEPYETEGCSNYRYLELATGKETETTLSACNWINALESYPFYVAYCPIFGCRYDFKTLVVVNLLTLERRVVHTLSNEHETTLRKCTEGNYSMTCFAEIYISNGEMSINVFKEEKREEDEVYENEFLRTDTIDLLHEFGIR